MLFAVLGRSVLGKTAPEVFNVFIFFFGTALKATFMLNFLLKKFSSNLAYARAFTKIKNCLQHFYAVTLFTTLLRCYKKLETFLQLEISERSVTRGPDGKIWTAGARAISQ